MNTYSIEDLQCANTIIENPSLYDFQFMTWAVNVKDFFDKVYKTARKIYNHVLWGTLSYGDALALVWANLKADISFDHMVFRGYRPEVQTGKAAKKTEKAVNGSYTMRSRAGAARNRVWSGHTPLQTKLRGYSTDLDAKKNHQVVDQNVATR